MIYLKTLKKSLIRYTAVVLSVMIAATASGCVRLNTAWYDFVSKISGSTAEISPVNQKLSEVDLVRLLTAAVRGDSDLTNYYRMISARQLDGLSLDEFQQYIRLLRKGIGGDVHSFKILSGEELRQQKEQMLSALPQEQDLIEASTAYWIIYRRSGRNDEKFAVFLQKAPDGLTYISARWVRQILDIADYATLYFDAADKTDAAAMSFLLDQQNPDDPVINAKANQLVSFYKNNITSRTSEYRLNKARLDSIGFDQFGITNPDMTQSVSRQVSFYIDDEGGFYTDDYVADVLKSADLEIYMRNEPVLKIGEISENGVSRVWSYQLEPIIGKPFIHDDSSCRPYGDETDRISLAYNGISIIAFGNCQDHQSWNGIISTVVINNSLFHTGGGLYPGMHVNEVLIRYPFAEQADYRIRGSFAGGYVTMQLTLENDTVKKIELTLASADLLSR